MLLFLISHANESMRDVFPKLQFQTMTVSKIHAKYTFLIILSIIVFILYKKTTIIRENASEITMGKNIYRYNDDDETKSKIDNEKIAHVMNAKKDFVHSINLHNALHHDSISEICSRYNLSTINLVKRHYLLSPENTSLYCWIRKAASTSFTKLYSDLRNRRVTRDYYKEVDILSPKTIDHLKSLINDDKVFKFLIVRHPFERIVSSFRDRIEDNTKYTAQSWIYVPQIFHLTRPYLFYTTKLTGSSLNRIFNEERRLKLVPSFKEFITWLLTKSPTSDDVHWDNYYSHCSICNVNYDYIMKLENNTLTDMDFILSKIGSIKNRNRIRKLRLEKTRGGLTDFEVTCKYLKTLTREMVLKLYQRYKIDFLLFGYSYKNYLKCITNLS